MDKEYSEQAEFSGAVNQLERISRNIQDAQLFYRLASAPQRSQFKVNDVLYNGGFHNFNIWQKCLYSNYLEVYPYLSKKEREEADKKYYNELITPFPDEKMGFGKKLLVLLEFDKWLMVALKEHGLLSRANSDPRTAVMD